MSRKTMTRSIAFSAATLLLSAVSQVCLADTTDLTEFFSGSGIINVWRCAGTTSSSLGVLADVDGNGVNDTLVVFTSIQGEAKAEYFANAGYGSYDFFFTGDRTQCGGGTGGVGRIGVRFVDMLAAGYPNTWTYKSVAGVRLVVHSDICVETSSSTVVSRYYSLGQSRF